MKSRFLRTLLLSVFVAAFCVNAVAKDFVLVIDAGHGGKDVGAVGDYAMEKDVNLGVALKFGELVKKHCKNVKFINLMNVKRSLKEILLNIKIK